MRSIYLFFICLMINIQLDAKVLIFTYSYNRPDFIELQQKTFTKFLKDEFDFVVFNDATDKKLYTAIKKKCRKLKITCIDIPQSIHIRPGIDVNAPSYRNANVVQYSLKTHGFYYDGIVALIDSDLFLVKEFSIENYLKDQHFAGAPQFKKNGEIEYLWIGLIFLNMATTPDVRTFNFDCGNIMGTNVDTGGFSYYYLLNHPNAKRRIIDLNSWPIYRCNDCEKNDSDVCLHSENALKTMGFDDHQITYIQGGPINSEFYLEQHFLHYRAGSNWDGKSKAFHEHKTKLLYDYMQSLLEN